MNLYTGFRADVPVPPPIAGCLAGLALVLLDVQRSLLELAFASAEVVDLLGTVVALDSKRLLAVEGEVAIVVDSPAVDVGTLGGGTGVRHGQSDGLVGVSDGVQVLPAGGSLVVGSVGHLGAPRAAADYTRLVPLWTGNVRGGHLRTRIFLSSVLPPMKALPGSF